MPLKLFFLSILLLVSFSACQQEATSLETSSNADGISIAPENPIEPAATGVVLKEGKVMEMMEDGSLKILEKEIEMEDGTKVTTGGKVMMKDGTEMMMKEGDKVMIDGVMIILHTS